MEDFYTKTWEFKTSLVDWYFTINLGQQEHLCDSKNTLLLTKTKQVFTAIENFANLGETSFTTDLDGEDAIVISKLSGHMELFEFIINNDQDIRQFDIDLDLKCFGISGAEYLLEGGASFLVFLESEKQYLTFNIIFSLNTNVYFPYNYGISEDNRKLSALNSPKLIGFLDRLQGVSGLTLSYLDAPYYNRAENIMGFILE